MTIMIHDFSFCLCTAVSLISSFIVNCRILQGETYKDVIHHMEMACRGLDYKIDILRHEEPSAISPADSEFFNKMAGAILGLNTEIAIIPYLMVAGTDSIKYECICKNILRFSPYTINMEDMKRSHGTNERISFDNIEQGVKFYLALFLEL